jgi:hypothetical protein
VGTGEALDLDELKALCAAATPGPWVAQVLGSDGYMVNRVLPDDADLREKMRRGVLKVNWLDWDSDKANAEFVAASRSAVPSLIAEVERLTVERDRARDIAVALEQQTAEIERIARDLYSRYGARGFEAAEAILRVLNPEPDEPRRRCAYCDALAVPDLPNHNDWPVCAEHADDVRLLETETQQ